MGLELRIPPVAVTLIAAGAMWGANATLPQLAFLPRLQGVAAVLIGAIGVLVCALGVFRFRRYGTTVDPFKPHAATELVADGIYRFSRNPMYLGFAIILAAWAAYLANAAAWGLLPMYLWYLQKFQIGPEERALLRLYGTQYEAYARRVRRWI